MNSLASLLQKNGRFIYESSEDIDVQSLTMNGPIIIAYGTRSRRAQCGNLKDVLFVDTPDYYLSEKKLRKFLEKPEFTGEEAAFLIKLLLWKENTKTLSRHDLSLFGEEYELWSVLAEEEFPDHILRKIKVANAIAVPHRLLVNPLWQKISCKTLIIEDALSLEDNLTLELQKKFSAERNASLFRLLGDETIQNAYEMIFGFLGMYWENNMEFPMTDVVLDRNFAGSLEGRKALAAAENLKQRLDRCDPSEPTKHLRTLIKDFQKCLSLGDWKTSGWTAWISMYREKLSITAAPVFVGDFLHRAIDAIPTVALKDSALSLDGDFSFLKGVFSLSDEWKSFSEETKMARTSLQIPDHLPEPNTEGYFHTCEAIIKNALNELGGNILVIAHAKKTIEALSTALIGETLKSGINLIAQGVSGGIGKSVEIFIKNPGHSILMGTAMLMNEFERLEPHVKCVIFQKLPFDFSATPLGKIRPQAFPNGYERYTIQKALLRFKNFLLTCQKGERKKIILLDTRLLTRDYGQKFLAGLQ